jgi:predicted alpha/beta superfamily hydrolase
MKANSNIRAAVPALAATALAALACLLSAAPALAQQPAAGGPARFTLKSDVLGEERTILVRTPAGYERGADRFPVLYLTDGDAHIGHTASTIEFLARNGRMPEMIVVGISNTDRTRDLTPTNAAIEEDGRAVRFPTSGGADKFLKFIETELIPAVESRYRTQPYRVFAGHSFGGLFAVHAFLSRPELFNAYIAVSPSLQWDNQLLVTRAEEFFKGRKELDRTLYFTIANEGGDMQQGFDRLKGILAENRPTGFEWGSSHMADEDHGSVVMPSHYLGLRKVFDGWQMPRDATGAVAGGLQGADEHYRKLSKRLGYTVPTPEALINQIGYQLLAAGKAEEAVATFKTNVERYPASANVYDSLAEAYERGGQLDLALPNYDKAYELGRKNGDPNTNLYKTNLDRVSVAVKQGASKAN